MSIIHDALKKAEIDRTKETPPGGKPGERPSGTNPLSGSNPLSGGNPFKIDDAPSARGKTTRSQVILLAVVLLALGGVVYWRVFHKSDLSPAQKPKPITVESETGATGRENVPLAKSASNPDKLRQEAMATFAIGNFEKSAEQWKQLALLVPTDPEVYNNLGLVLKKLAKNKESKEAYEKALGLNPDYPEGLNNLGVVLMEEQDRKRAKSLFEKAVQLNPEYGEAFFHLAMILENEGNYAGAVKNYQEFLHLRPSADSVLKAQVEIRIAVLKAEANRAR